MSKQPSTGYSIQFKYASNNQLIEDAPHGNCQINFFYIIKLKGTALIQTVH